MAAANSPSAPIDFAILRRTMVDCQIRTFDVTDQSLLAQFDKIPREQFLPPELAPLAYSDHTLKLKCATPEEGQRSLLPPLILARMMQAGGVRAADKVLDLAPGSGYSTALFAALGCDVVALESDPELTAAIDANLKALDSALGLTSARALTGPLAAGAPAQAPFDLIFINGAVETQLEPLFGQLKDGGRLIAIKIAPTGPDGLRASRAVRYDKVGGSVGWRYLFDATAPVLGGFRASVEFVF